MRARFAERLISSLDGDSDPDSEAAWLAEAERRLAEIENGSTVPLSAEVVFDKARSSLE